MDASIDILMPSSSMQLDQQLDGVSGKGIAVANQKDDQGSQGHQFVFFFQKARLKI
ncbi:hypothetical protein QS257_16780 [Terrilactibacillus sp. S3-3]|nr:hypothetical protein QS257_16780 [Terrilactibacillus sp. S3-3]